MNQRSRQWLPSVTWALVILTLCLLPKSDLPDDSFFSRIPFFDKLVHVGLFFVFYLALRYAVPSRVWANVLICVLFGGLVEVLQEATALGRSAEWLDLLSDAIGATFAAVAALVVRSRRSS